jgi:hypothetical protein
LAQKDGVVLQYEALEGRGVMNAIRIPANESLEGIRPIAPNPPPFASNPSPIASNLPHFRKSVPWVSSFTFGAFSVLEGKVILERNVHLSPHIKRVFIFGKE